MQIETFFLEEQLPYIFFFKATYSIRPASLIRRLTDLFDACALFYMNPVLQLWNGLSSVLQ